jgi:concentrative nucleoside transporter, CNT family
MFLIDYLLMHNRYLSLVGIALLFGIAYLCSHHRASISIRLVINGLITHFLLAFLVLRTNIGTTLVGIIALGIKQLYHCADEGTRFLFGNLSVANDLWGFIFAVKVLPIIIFFGAFTGLLLYCGIIGWLVSIIRTCIQPILGTSGAETLCAIANSFLGQTEAPLLIKQYLSRMTVSEIFLVMVSGMGTISSSILAVYASLGVPTLHLLNASVMAIPATIIMAKIWYPETQKPVTLYSAKVEQVSEAANVIDAISLGTLDGLRLALNVGAMLISFLALLALTNILLWVGSLKWNFLMTMAGMPNFQIPVLTLSMVLGWLFAPFGWLLGLTGIEMHAAGMLLGTKIAVNEMVAYSTMVTMNLSERTVILLTYALCGFANFSSIGIQLGSIGALIPERRPLLSSLGIQAVIASTFANLLSAFVAALFL